MNNALIKHAHKFYARCKILTNEIIRRDTPLADPPRPKNITRAQQYTKRLQSWYDL